MCETCQQNSEMRENLSVIPQSEPVFRSSVIYLIFAIPVYLIVYPLLIISIALEQGVRRLVTHSRRRRALNTPACSIQPTILGVA